MFTDGTRNEEIKRDGMIWSGMITEICGIILGLKNSFKHRIKAISMGLSLNLVYWVNYQQI